MEADDLHLVNALAGVAVASAYVCVGLVGLSLHRYRLRHAWLFTLTCCTFAWATAVAPMQPLVAERHPWIYALSTGLSGYAAPALMLFTSRAVDPRRPLSLAWLLLGVPGTTFCAMALTHDDMLGFLVAFREHDGPRWHARLSPLYLAHVVTTIAAMTCSTYLVLRGLRHGHEGPHRTALRWLAAAHVSGWIGVVTYGLLPGVFHMVTVIELTPWVLGIPALALLFRSLTALSEAAAAKPRAEAATRNLASVANALRGMSEGVGHALAEIAEHAEALAAPASPAEQRLHAAGVRKACGTAERTVQRMLRFATHAPRASEDVRVAPRLRAAAYRHGTRLQATVSVDPEAEEALVRIDASALDDALDALLDNAAEARRAPSGPNSPRVRVQAVLERPAAVDARAIGAELWGVDALRITVTDDGHGMTPDVLEQALVPFFTTRPGAAGLGCVDVVSTMRDAGGALLLESKRGTGTTVTLWLPVAAARLPDEASEPVGTREVPALAVVTPDARTAELLRLLFDARGAACLAHASATAPRALERASGLQTLLLVLDRRDPSSEELLAMAARLVARRTDVHLIVVGAPADASRALRLSGGDRVVALRHGTAPAALVAQALGAGRRQGAASGSAASSGTHSVTRAPA